MKKFAIAAGMAMLVSATAAQAHGDHPGFVMDTAGGWVKTMAGECVKTIAWKEGDVCDEMTPVVVEEPKMVNVRSVKTYALYFDFDSTVVGRVSNIVDHIGSLSFLKEVNLVGHADPIGSEEYNMGLSQRRAEAVAAKLSEAGVAADKIKTAAKGETAPVANCTGKGAQLIACLRPDRRVDVEVVGEVTQKQ